MARLAPRDTAAVTGVGPKTGGNHHNIPDAPQPPAETTDTKTPSDDARRLYTVMPDLLVEAGKGAA